MLSAKEISEYDDRHRYPDGSNVTYDSIMCTLAENAEQYGIPIAFSEDSIQQGGFFSKAIDCIVLHHPDHLKDYFNFPILITRQGSYAYVQLYIAGKSKQMKYDQMAQGLGSNAKAFWNGTGGSEATGGMIGGLFGMIGRNKNKLAEEQNWYEMIGDLFEMSF